MTRSGSCKGETSEGPKEKELMRHTQAPTHAHTCEHTSTEHVYTAEPDNSVRCWPSAAVCVWERRRGGERAERKGEQTIWTTSMLTLHFPLIHHLKQKGHWLWDKSRAARGRAEQRATTAARMQTVLDVLILPTAATLSRLPSSTVGRRSISGQSRILKLNWPNSTEHTVTTSQKPGMFPY